MNAPAPFADPSVATAFVHHEERLRAARTLAELRFTIANETFGLFPYRQAFVWDAAGGRARLETVSGLAKPAADAPFGQWLGRVGDALLARPSLDGEYVGAVDLPAAVAADWGEWLPDWLLCFTVDAPDGGRLAIVAFALDEPVPDALQPWVARLPGAWSHAWRATLGSRMPSRSRPLRRVLGWGLAIAAVAAMLIPVRTSVLAPAEIAPLRAFAVSAPMDGVVKTFHVAPNQAVVAGEKLFTLDDTTLRNRREVALRQLATARADALAAAQKAFADATSRAELAALEGRVAERRAELESIDQLLGRVDVVAPKAGVVVFGDTVDWEGRPVVTGERVALLADPQDAGVLVWLPVADAIALDEGVPLRLFLRVAPTRPLEARIEQTSYQATLSPEGVASYRLRARFDALDPEDAQRVRIGLAGTAKVYGERAPLGYAMLRRPLAALREWTGW
ncbi:MAG: HlyD family efflux transporter periplasmic adaptor subunit [Burkholderiales bacterium]